ncbi:MAG: 30S ribosomal protein S6 [Candidatus Moranbacteria bacterium]|nr:30S ribosomal protein S6 [Candidatus Moranbacteria bacterium]
MKYELFYLVAASKETELEAIKKEAEEIVTSEGGVFEEKEVAEKRKLAYQIKHETHGVYVARRFNIEETEKLQAITRKLNLCTNILRSVVSRADELPELKTKEERIAAASAKPERKPKEEKAPVVAAKVAPVAEKKEEVKEEVVTAVEEKKATEDIDKKLEEILNI